MSTTVLPNRALGYPALNDTGWGNTLDASLINVDAAFGGNQAFALPSSLTPTVINVSASSYNGPYPANVASYVPLSWTLTGTPLSQITLQLPSGVGGQWVVNNQTSQGPVNIIVSAVGGSTSATLAPNTVQTVYSDGLGNISIISNSNG